MRDRMDRFVVLPFSIGCVSQSSVAIGDPSQPKKSKSESIPPAAGRQKGEERSSSPNTRTVKNSFGFLPLPKPNFSNGFQKLVRGFKTFSQFFVYKLEENMEEVEMEIGLPTDVKHVTHIGWDGSTTTNPDVKCWDNLKAPELLSFPAISLRQFELAMAAQADHHGPPPLLLNATSCSKLANNNNN